MASSSGTMLRRRFNMALSARAPRRLRLHSNYCYRLVTRLASMPLDLKKGAGGGGTDDVKKGDCNRCDSYFCTQATRAAGKYDGKPICILDKNSTFDIKTISNGGGRYVSLGRSWHQGNPNATTFKGVRFRVASSGSQPTGESMNALGAEGTILVRELFGNTCNVCEASEWLVDAE